MQMTCIPLKYNRAFKQKTKNKRKERKDMDQETFPSAYCGSPVGAPVTHNYH